MSISPIKQKKMLDELLDSCRRNLPKANIDLITKAFNLSFESHKNDTRESGAPYFTHPYAVARIIVDEIPLDDSCVIAALLHDVVEDTDVSLDFIQKEFGKEVADIVDGVTKISGIFKGLEIQKAENYRKLVMSMINDVRVILVKFADRLDNMRTLNFCLPEKQMRIATETREIYAPFAHRLGLGQIKWEMEDLAFKYLNREAYDTIARKVANTRKDRENYIAKFCAPIKEKLKEYNIEAQVDGRPKHLYSIYKKMINQNKSFEEIYDILAIRIIIENNDKILCFSVLGVVNSIYKNVPERFKDYITVPKKNNYQSIHNTVVGPEGKFVEVQIRTREMHEIAEKGIAAHWKYKENVSKNNLDVDSWINWARNIFETSGKADSSKEIISTFKVTLNQEEIFVYTPKGDLKQLPANSTPVDFAFEIHSNIGLHCIGAKVNGKIVPLDTILKNGDQVEILTSKNQHPNRSWLDFVKSSKAKSNINKYLKSKEEKLIEEGKEIWEKKLKKMKKVFSTDDLNRLIKKLKYDNFNEFYSAIALDKIKVEELFVNEEENNKKLTQDFEFDDFANITRTDVGGVIIEGDVKGINYSYAKCCNPIPGDPIVGFITTGEGIKIHRKNCDNVVELDKKYNNKFVRADWSKTIEQNFVAAISIKGEDAPGLLNTITNNINQYKNTNIKGINMNSEKNHFSGIISVYVENLEHLNRLIERLKKIHGIYSVERFEGSDKEK
jgi:RelA/SpoT family (p)ppGpp synthetase